MPTIRLESMSSEKSDRNWEYQDSYRKKVNRKKLVVPDHLLKEDQHLTGVSM
jgi:hypothetical protein